MTRKRTELSYYLTGDLTENQTKLLDCLKCMTTEQKERLASVLMESAEYFDRDCVEITLREPQVEPVLMSTVNDRIFLGDSPGLGKTVMSAGAYAFYKLKEAKEGRTPGKVIVLTESSHVVSFAKEWTSYGIKMLPFTSGTKDLQHEKEHFEELEYDGVVLTYDRIKTNDFTEFYLDNKALFDFGVFDETSKLRNPASITYKAINSIVNEYKGGLKKVIFLNGSSFEKEVYDLYYQFSILKPKLIPSKAFLDERYVNKEMNFIHTKNRYGKVEKRRTFEIVGYRNQVELKDRLKYYFIARDVSDYTDKVLEHPHQLHMVQMNDLQKSRMRETKNITVVNSPSTTNEEWVTSPEECPKIKSLLEFVDTVKEDRPLIYVFNKDSQAVITEELQKKGYKACLLNGDMNQHDKATLVEEFNQGKYDVMVLNVMKAISIPTSNRMIFYDIPTMPQATNQIKGRINRNNYTKVKFYDFFCYEDSPEMVNLVRLGYFREQQANLFTGQVSKVYEKLMQQLEDYLQEDVKEKVNKLVQKSNGKFEDVSGALERLLAMANN